MRNVAEFPPCDRCDTKLTNVNTPGLNERQRRFLDAYRQWLAITPAARSAGVHRATVYRWRRDAAFADAMRVASQEFFRELRAKVLAEEAARQVWRDKRERERRSMRCFYLARARAAKHS